MPTLREALSRIATEYSAAATENPKGHPLAQFLRNEAPAAVEDALGEIAGAYKVVGSPGKGNWASVPWISVFDPDITDSATKGYYVVYLVNPSEGTISLSLNQGATAVRNEFKDRAREILKSRATLMRARLRLYERPFSSHSIRLGSTKELPLDYEAGHALGLTYRADALPSEESLRNNLRDLVTAYRRLTYLGGLEQSIEQSEAEEIEKERPTAQTVEEQRQYKLHRKIERQSGVSERVKKLKGYTCEACSFRFEDCYGPVGSQFIEAHHRTPLGTLAYGQRVTYRLDSDFYVLCANCHRMIHRMKDTSDLEALKDLILSHRRGNPPS